MRFNSVLIFFALLCTVSFAFARPWTPDDDVINGIPVEGAVQITSQTLGIGHLKIHISNPVVKMEQVDLNKRTWTLVTIDGETRIWHEGDPALPMIARAIRMPNTGTVSLSYKLGDYDEYRDIDVLPQQPTELKKVGDVLEPVSYALNNETYSRDQWFPSEVVGLTSPEIIRDARVALLGVQPVIYNPVTRTIRVYKSIDVEILPVGGNGINEIYNHNSHAVQSFWGIYSDIIGAEDLADDARRAPPGQTMLIARAGVDTLLRAFANWKTQSGHPTQIYAVPSSTSNTSPIQTYINNAYNTWNPPLETIVIIGDGDPTNSPYDIPTYSENGDYTDQRFGIIGTGINASMWVGRIHCDNQTEMQMQLNKSMNYEKTPNMGPTGSDTAWFNHGWGWASQVAAWNEFSNAAAIHFCVDMMRQRGMTNAVYAEYTDSHVNTSIINTNLTPGAIFWAHRCSWIGEIYGTDLDGIQNINKPFVGFNITCATGEWYGASASGIHKAATKLGTVSQPRGALTSISTETSSTNVSHNNVMAAGCFYGFGVKNGRTPGPMYFEGKFQLWRNYRFGNSSDSTTAASFITWNNPLGDISAYIWTGVPQHVTMNSPDSISIGQNRLALQVMRGTAPVTGAMVTAWKKNAAGINETYTRGITDDSGRVSFTLTNLTTGQLLLTVTGNQIGQNIYPHADTVVVYQSSTDLAFSNYTVQDDSTGGRSGNNNGTANPGETIDVNVQLINRGSSTATGISGILSSADPRVTVVNNEGAWGNVSAGTTVNSTTPFRIQLGTGFHDNDLVPLQLNLVTNQGNRTITLPVTIRTIQIAYMSQTLNPATLNVGQSSTLSLSLRNNGGLSTGAATVTVASLSPFVVVTNGTATFTSLPIGSNVSNPGGQLFTLTANGRTIPGTIANLSAIIASGANHDTVVFSVTIGTRHTYDPVGPDPYGYLAYDNTDTNYRNLAPTYQWVDIIPGINSGPGTRLNLNDAAVTNSTTDCSMAIRLPFTARFYGAAYDTITVCSNGWLAFGSQAYYQNCRDWHLPAFEGPRNMVAVNWCDQTNTSTNEGAFVYNDTTNHRYVVTWKTTTVNSPIGQEYQCIIYNPNYSQTPTGDSPLKFQYKTYNPAIYSGYEQGVSYASIGIADSNYTRALEYCYWNTYDPGCASIPTGTPTSGQRAILFTTAQPATGNLTGTVRRASDNTPISGVQVLMLNGGRNATSDAAGHYTMTNLQIGHYTAQASGMGVNTRLDTVTIYDSLTSTLDFTLTNPTLRLAVNDTIVRPNDSIAVTLLDSGSTMTTTRNIFVRNTGNGPLTWNSQLLYGGNFDETDSLWDQVFSFNVTQAVGGDNQIFGVEFDGNNFWVTGANNYTQPHHLYKLDRNGNLLHAYNCPDQTGLYGWRDLTWDGHRYLYSAYSSVIDKIDTADGSVVQTYNTSINPVRAIAIDTAANILYYGDQASAVYKMRLSDGATYGTIQNPSGTTPGGLWGLAYYASDPSGMNLYAFVRDSSSFNYGTRLYKINPTTGTTWTRLVKLGLPNERAAGLSITPRWNPMLWTACAVMQTTTSCRIALFELAFNTLWIGYTPKHDTLQAGQQDTVTVSFNSLAMPDGRYRVAIRFLTNDTTGSVTVPVAMTVTNFIDGVRQQDNGSLVPLQFSLEQNYPNPFNPVTTISFSLPKTSSVKFAIYDQLGREVARLVTDRAMAVGRHTMSFNGSRLASGVYFYRLEAGSYVAARKMLLLK